MKEENRVNKLKNLNKYFFGILVVFMLSCLTENNVSTTNASITPLATNTHTMLPETSIPETSTIPATKTSRPTKEITFTRTKWITGDEAQISSYYGDWVVMRYEHYGTSAFATDEYADKQIGKGMQLQATEIKFDDGFLGYSAGDNCSSVTYKRATQDEFVGHGWQALLPEESPEKREGDLLFFDVYCSGKMLLGFEISKTSDIVIYVDQYWFFLEIVLPEN
jgi:hypothetical protein